MRFLVKVRLRKAAEFGMKLPGRLFALLFLGIGLCLTVRLAAVEADFRLDSAAPLRSPTWLNASNLVRSDSSPEELRAAVRLNPRLAAAWLQLGLDAEANGNFPGAEADLLRAARVDRQYVPSWTLANFYFRRGDAVKFWPWARRAAELTYDDYRPLLRLADTLETSSREVAASLGGGAPLLRAYLDLLIGARRPDSARAIADLLRTHHDPVDQARLAAVANLP
jgi:tetratricopeptide (TPR) repeat protein